MTQEPNPTFDPSQPPNPPPAMGQPPTGAPPPMMYESVAPLGKRRSVGLVILLSIVTCGVWTIVWSYQQGEELQRFRNRGLGGVVYLIVTLLASPVTMFLLPNEIEEAYHERGLASPVSLTTGLWFLLPLAGSIVWYVKTQEAINEYWTMLGQTNEPGL